MKKVTRKQFGQWQILAQAQELNDLRQVIRAAYVQLTAKNPRTEADIQAYQQLCDRFHANFDRLAFPGGWEQGRAALKAQEPVAIDFGIAYLEANPMFFRSGYIKQEIAQLLKKAAVKGFDFTAEQRTRLQAVFLRTVIDGCSREFRSYCQLARQVSDAAFVTQITQLTQTSDDAGRRSRAKLLLHYLVAVR